MASGLKLAALAGLTAAAASFGATFTPRRRNRWWYAMQRKPSFTPPDAVFGPVWTTLYSLMTWSAWRVSKAAPSRERTTAMALWGTQLGLNAAWPWLFFGRKNPRAALADLLLLMAATGAYTAKAAHIDRPAAWMMAPYLGWSTFATVLNAEIVRRNA